jgi:AcrR family transcriptional regulator
MTFQNLTKPQFANLNTANFAAMMILRLSGTAKRLAFPIPYYMLWFVLVFVGACDERLVFGDHGAGNGPTGRLMGKHISKEDWLSMGLAAVAKNGPDGLTVEAMCERAGKTRGSFYHHFSSAADFRGRLLEWWRETFTEQLIEKSERLTRPGKKLDHLNQLAAHLDPAIEQGIRRLAATHDDAGVICREVDRIRTQYLAQLYRQSGHYKDEQASMLARIEYAAWVGFQLTEPEAEPQEMLAMYDSFLRLTGRKK